MKKAFPFILLSLFFVLIAYVAIATTTDWSFSTPTNYTYDTDEISVSSGAAQLTTDFFDGDWQYRQAITVNNTANTNALAEYQVEIDLDNT